MVEGLSRQAACFPRMNSSRSARRAAGGARPRPARRRLPRRPGLLRCPCRALPSPRHARAARPESAPPSALPAGAPPGQPVSRPGTRAEIADCGSVPSSTTSRPGASNAAHANLEGGRTEPISNATSRVPVSSDQMPCDPRLQADRRQLPPASRRVNPSGSMCRRYADSRSTPDSASRASRPAPA